MPARVRYFPAKPGKIRIIKRWGRWWWYCNMCYPGSCGSTMSYEKTMKNVQRHCEHLQFHHAYVRRNSG